MLDPKPVEIHTPVFWPLLALGLLAAGTGLGLAALWPADFCVHWFRQGTVLAAVHLVTLGALGTIFLAVSGQALNVLFHQPWSGARVQAWGLALFHGGAWALVAFLAGARQAALLAAALAGLLGGYGLLAWRAWRLAAAAKPKTLAWKGLRLAHAALGHQLALGAAMAIGLLHPLLPMDPLRTLRFHVHLGLWGFASLAIFGLLPKLLRLFQHSTGYANGPIRAAVTLVRAGLVLDSLAWIFSWDPLAVAASVTYLLAAAAFVLQMALLLEAAKPLKPDSSLATQALAASFLVAAAAGDLWLEIRGGSPGAMAACVWVGLLGWVLGTVLGTLQRIVAILSWFDRFQVLSADRLVPTAWDLVDPRLAWSVPILHAAAVLVGAWGLLWLNPSQVRWGALLELAAIAATLALAAVSRRRGRDLPFPGGVNPYLQEVV